MRAIGVDHKAYKQYILYYECVTICEEITCLLMSAQECLVNISYGKKIFRQNKIGLLEFFNYINDTEQSGRVAIVIFSR